MATGAPTQRFIKVFAAQGSAWKMRIRGQGYQCIPAFRAHDPRLPREVDSEGRRVEPTKR